MKRIIALLMVLILVCGTPLSAYAQPEEGSDNDLNEEAYEEPVSVMRTIYVSATGDDSGNGSSESPYRTIEKARQEVAMISGNMSGDIIVSIADGDYYLEDILQFGTADSGTNGYCIRYKAEGSNSVISGGREVIGTWKDEGNGIFSIEYVRDEKLRSLYVNGQRAYMSSKKLNGRGGYGSYSVKAGQADWAWIDGSVFQGTLFDAGSIPLDTRNPDDIELQTQTTWNTAIVSVDNLEDCGNGKISANLQMPYGAIAQKPSWGNNYKVSGEQTVYNVFEWLDEPGEFYFDKSGKRLYYYPREGENLETAQVVVPELQTLVNIQGESTENRVHNISFEGLTFAHTDWNLYEIEGSTGRATVQGAAGVIAFADGNWHPSIYRAYDVGPGAIMASSASELHFEKNTICNTGNDGLSLVNDVTDTIVNGNIVYDLAGSALLIGHPQHVYIGDKGGNKGDFSDEEKYDVGEEGSCQNIAITNNFISGTSKMFWGDAGVMVFLGEKLQIQNNHIEDTPYSALSLGWGWWNMNGSANSVVPGEPSTTTRDNIITHNTFLNTIKELGDGGAIYTLGDMPGTIISENYICGLGTIGKNPYHIRGIHVDEGTKNVYGEKNVFEIPTSLSCIDCGNWGNKGNNTWDNNYSTSDSYTTTGSYESGTKITNKHTNAAGIWGSDVFEILANAGLQSEYISKLPESLYKIQDKLLPTKFFLKGDQELEFKVDPKDINANIWLAPEGTEIFAAGTDMTKAEAGKIKVPQDEGTYKLYLVNEDIKSEPSKGEIIVANGNLTENIEEDGSYKTSQANPFKIQIKDAYVKEVFLNGEKINAGYEIKDEGEQELVITDLNDSKISIKFSTYIDLVDKVFDKNTFKVLGETVKLKESNNETFAWFVPEEMEILDISQLVESDQMTKAAEVNAKEINTPKAPGKYVLYLVNGVEISGPSEAVLTVAANDFSVTEGLVARFNAEDIGVAEGEKVNKWEDMAGGYTLLQNKDENQPTLKKTDLGMPYVEFNGTTSEMLMDSNQVLDLNGKSNLSIVTFSAYTGADPTPNTYGDTMCTVYFGESGSWGSTYLSSYGGFIVSRFGSGQANNFIKANRQQQNNDFVMTAMVKDKATELIYDDGKKIATVTGKYEKTNNNKTTMMVGKTASGTPSYFHGGISEILIYDRTLSEEEISNLQSYMMTKYYLSQLNPILKEAQGILYEEGAEDKYNSISWKNLQDSHDQAILIKEQVVNGEKVVSESVKAACENLRNAIDSMKEVITAIPADKLSLWLKADEGVVKGEDGRVNVWQDSSGAGHNAIIAQNPQNGENLTSPELVEDGYSGKPVVRFNGTSDGMQFPFGNIDKTSEATVVIISSSKSDKEETYGGDNIPLLYFHEYGGGWSKFVITPTSGNVNARFGSGRSDDNGGYMCYERPDNIGEDFSTTVAVKSGSDETIYVGDQEVMSRSNGSATFTNVKDDIGYLGRYPVGNNTTSWYNQSDVAEIMIYNRALGLVEIQQINAYINSKYNISVELSSISLEEPAKTEYTIGEELDLEGLKVTAHYSDGSSKELEQEAYEVSGFDSNQAGEKTVTVTYEGKSAEFKVMIKEVEIPAELTSISLEGPAKTQYIIGEELDLEGLKVIAHYSDGSSIELEQEAYEVSGFDSTEAGEKTVTVTCEGVSAEFKVLVKEVETPAELTAISLEGPEKTEYVVGEELDLEGLKVMAHYSDGSSKEVEQEAYEVSGFDSTEAGEKTVTVTYEGMNAEFKVMVNIIEIPLISISLDQTNVELTSGSELKLTVLFNPDNTTDPKGIVWSSSNEDIATVEDGTVYAIMKGETTITALVGDKYATCKVIVIEDPEEPVIVTGIVLDKEHIFFSEKGAKAQLEAQIMPENATNKNIIWSSDNNGVATVESGIITAISNGTAIITAESEDGGLKAFCKVEVKIPPVIIEVREVKINKSQITLKPGQTERLAAEIIPENATDKTVKWTSSNRNVIIVENDGTIKAIQSGVATITASSLNGKTAKCTVTVQEPEKGYISFQDGGYSLYVTESKQTKIIINATAGNITGYRSDNPKVVTVSSKGIIKGVSKGATYIHVTTDKGITARVKVKVNVPKIKLNYTKLPLQINKSTNQLKITGKIKTDQIRSWRSKDKKVATVDKKGKIKAHKVGLATIEVTMKSGAKASCVIKVQKNQVKATKLLLNKTKISLKKGKTFKLAVTKVPVTAGDKIKFSSSKNKVATVTSKGNIRGVKKGTATIYIKASGGKKRSCKVTIN